MRVSSSGVGRAGALQLHRSDCGVAAQLTQLWRSRSYLNEELVWSYLAQITLALYDCHSEVDKQGRSKPVILHRDIKPENGTRLQSRPTIYGF